MTNRLLVFIHGLGGDAVSTWAKFPALLAQDADLAALHWHIASFQYDTGTVAATRPLADIAFELANFIDTKTRELQVDEIAFIAHSQGGLLARRYLCNVLKDPPVAPTPIFRLLTFATPHWGAYSEAVGKRLPESMVQQRELAFDSAAILAVNSDWAQTDAEDRIKVQRVIAGEDAIVPRFSALGADFHNDYRVVPKYGHVDVVKVNDATHPSLPIAKAFLLDAASHQPALANPDKTPPVLRIPLNEDEDIQGNSRFIYASRYIPFLERDSEKQQVMAFLLAPAKKNIAWMWVKGQGGVGKSRLALELCLAAQADWHAGFLNRDADAPDWARWQPQLPTLLVIDYATADIDKLGSLLRGLCNRDAQSGLRRPVRVLLLDRHQQEDRLQQAIGQGAGALGITACRRPDLELQKIDNPWAIIEHFLSLSGKAMPDQAQTLDRLARIDPAQRPLFAMLLADALAQNLDVGAITRESLLQNVIDRERASYWRPAAGEHHLVLEKQERLLAFATVVNGLSLAAVRGPIDSWDPDTAAPVFAVMAGYDGASDTIAPLAPDLLGECFALQKLNGMPKQKALDALALAWNRWPLGTFSFFDRAAQDFPTDELLDATLGVSLPDWNGRNAWSGWVVNLIARTAEHFPERAARAYEALDKLAAAYPGELEIRSRLAKAAVNLIAEIAAADPAAAKAVFMRLCELADATPDTAEIRQLQARAALNLISQLVAAEPETAQAIFTGLCDRAARQPDEPEIRLAQANASLILIHNFAASDPDTAEEIFAGLGRLVAAHPDESTLRLIKANVTVYLTDHFDVNPAAIKAALADIRALSDNADEVEIRLDEAKAAVVLIDGFAATDPGAAMASFVELCELANAHPDEPKIRLEQAKAAYNLIYDFAASDPAAAKEVFAILSALADAHPGEPDVREVHLNAVVLIVQNFTQSDNGFVVEVINRYEALLAAFVQRKK